MHQAKTKLITLLLTSALASAAFAHTDHDDKSQRTWSDAEAQKIIQAAEEQTKKEKELAKEAELAEVDSENSKTQDGQGAKKAAESADMELKQ